MIHIENRVWKLLLDAPRPSIFKTFLYIALNQPDDGLRGFIIEKSTLAFNLGMSQPTIFRDLKFLKDNLLIYELKLAENSDFMANPYLVIILTEMLELPKWHTVNVSIPLVNSVCVKKDEFAPSEKIKSKKISPDFLSELFLLLKLIYSFNFIPHQFSPS